MLFKLSNLNSNLALTLGYLNPALNNSALFIKYKNCSLVCVAWVKPPLPLDKKKKEKKKKQTRKSGTGALCQAIVWGASPKDAVIKQQKTDQSVSVR